MAEILNFVSNAITGIISAMGYVGIALVMFLENVFPPIPSELVMPFAGFLVAEGEMNFVVVIIAGTIGAMLGAVVLYYLGVVLDEPVIRAFIRRFGRYFMISEQDMDRALDFFAKYGSPIIFFGRLIPIIRSLISIPAGMNRMPLGTFLIFTTLGTATWNIILTAGGWVLGENWERIIEMIDTYENIVIVILVICVIVFLAYKIREYLQNRNQEGEAA